MQRQSGAGGCARCPGRARCSGCGGCQACGVGEVLRDHDHEQDRQQRAGFRQLHNHREVHHRKEQITGAASIKVTSTLMGPRRSTAGAIMRAQRERCRFPPWGKRERVRRDWYWIDVGSCLVFKPDNPKRGSPEPIAYRIAAPQREGRNLVELWHPTIGGTGIALEGADVRAVRKEPQKQKRRWI